MDANKFENLVKEIVANYCNEHLDKTDNKQISPNSVYIVWMCKTLQNNKALLSTPLLDGRYYEVTYNGNKNEFYLDVYKKWENRAIQVG